MSSDRERIIEFDASTSIPADGWFAIDSTTEGTRKIQKSAIIGSGSLDTTSQEVISAINEVNQRAATIDSMTQDEYDDLPSTKESDNVPRFITDGVPTFDETLWNKVGTDPLDTTAQDCSGAINEINTNLTNLGSSVFLGRTQNTITTTAQSVTLSEAFRNYLLVNIELRESSNVVATLTLTTEYIDVTTSSSCPKLYFNGNYVEVYKVDSTHLGVKGSTSFGSSYNVAIRGILKTA